MEKHYVVSAPNQAHKAIFRNERSARKYAEYNSQVSLSGAIYTVTEVAGRPKIKF